MTQAPPVAQKVRWGPSDAVEAGLKVWAENTPSEETFIPWKDLKIELERKLIPQLFMDPTGFSVRTSDYFTKKDWLVEILDGHGDIYCHVWFGGDPECAWEFDGLVRVGDPEQSPIMVWQIYSRYSDGSYRLLKAKTPTLDEMKRKGVGS